MLISLSGSSDVRFSYPSPASSKNPCGVSSYKNNGKRHKMILLVKVLLQKRYKKNCNNYQRLQVNIYIKSGGSKTFLFGSNFSFWIQIQILTVLTFKGIVSRDFEGLQMILMNTLCAPDVPLVVYSFLNLHLHIAFWFLSFERVKFWLIHLAKA